MTKIVVIIVIALVAAMAGSAGGYAAGTHNPASARSCTGTERSLAHSLAMQAQGYGADGKIPLSGSYFDAPKPRQLSAAELELVRACDR